jgi:alcohol dehydrogenase
MVQAVLFHGSGRPLEIVQLPMPEPQGQEILVRVTCSTLCRSDLHTHSGRRIEATPTVLGHEIVGRIAAFGSEAPRVDALGQDVRIGDRVTWAVAVGCGRCFFCADELPQKCELPYKYGHERVHPDRPFAGGLAEAVILVPGTAMYRVPDEVSDHLAAPANCATATVAALLRYSGPVAGRNVLVLGAGVLGVTACALASASGARTVLACDPSPECRERAVAFGATHAVSSEPGELQSSVSDATRGRGVDVALELSGTAGAVQSALSLARVGGTVVLAGTVLRVGNVGLDPEKVVRRMLTIRGVHNYHPRDLASALAFLAGAGRRFPFDSLIATEYRLVEVEQAFAFAHAHPGVRVAVIP